MRSANIITAAVLLLAGIAVAFESFRLGAGWGRSGPEAGFYPFWIGVLLALTALALVVQAVMDRTSEPFIERSKLALVAKVGLPAVALVALIHWAGLYLSAALYIAVYMRWIGSYPWVKALIVGTATAGVAFLVFEVWFLTPMPKGPLEVWLGY